MLGRHFIVDVVVVVTGRWSTKSVRYVRASEYVAVPMKQRHQASMWCPASQIYKMLKHTVNDNDDVDHICCFIDEMSSSRYD